MSSNSAIPLTRVGTNSFVRAPATIEEITRKGQIRLAERIDPVRNRHKPLSILRQEAKRFLDQFFEAECPQMPKPERDQLVQKSLNEAVGFGPLEELFRDEAVLEIMILSWQQVIARKGESWLPTSVRFQNAEHLWSYIQKVHEIGEKVSDPTMPTAGFDVRLLNGFRVLSILPPAVMEQPPLTLLIRGEPPPASLGQSGVRTMQSSGVTGMGSGSIAHPARRTVPPTGGSGTTSQLVRPNPNSWTIPTQKAPPTDAATLAASIDFDSTAKGDSGTISRLIRKPTPLPPTQASLINGLSTEQVEKIRRKVSERIVSKCASLGIYDITQISNNELQRVIEAHIVDLNESYKLNLDETEQQKLVLEILMGMKR